jgi:hypothetical protein
MPRPAISRTAQHGTDRLAGSAINAVNRDKVGWDASPAPWASGVSPAEELGQQVATLDRGGLCLESGGNSLAAFSERVDLGLIRLRGQG